VPGDAHPAQPRQSVTRLSPYSRVLRLRHLRLTAWQGELLFWVPVVVGALLALADVATAWSPLVLPAAVALVVVFLDQVERGLARQRVDLG